METRKIEVPVMADLFARFRGNRFVSIYLPVRVGDGCSHGGTPIFKYQHIGNIITCDESAVTLCPEVHNLACLGRKKCAKGLVMVGGVEHHLTSLIRHCRPTVRKRKCFIRVGCLDTTYAKRAVTCRQIWTILS